MTSGRSNAFRTAVYASVVVIPPTATPPTVTPAAIRCAVVVAAVVVVVVSVTVGSEAVVAVVSSTAPIAPGAAATTAARPPPRRQPTRSRTVSALRFTAFEDSSGAGFRGAARGAVIRTGGPRPHVRLKRPVDRPSFRIRYGTCRITTTAQSSPSS